MNIRNTQLFIFPAIRFISLYSIFLDTVSVLNTSLTSYHWEKMRRLTWNVNKCMNMFSWSFLFVIVLAYTVSQELGRCWIWKLKDIPPTAFSDSRVGRITRQKGSLTVVALADIFFSPLIRNKARMTTCWLCATLHAILRQKMWVCALWLVEILIF